MKSDRLMTTLILAVIPVPGAAALALYDVISLKALFSYVALCVTLGLLIILYQESHPS
ncbi:hypothetical protein [Vibrio barjaei]|uniref:hypothetical protein n=1 Tax=Vibrio barjaei TaxID=1676683 RepID=UPI002284C077|nr:hypothetical protein [Vibrio barjaei]MCY9874888.1 hypothetical protein [Vibrio barjaei]